MVRPQEEDVGGLRETVCQQVDAMLGFHQTGVFIYRMLVRLGYSLALYVAAERAWRFDTKFKVAIVSTLNSNRP